MNRDVDLVGNKRAIRVFLHSATSETHVVFLYAGRRGLRLAVRLHHLLVFFVPGAL